MTSFVGSYLRTLLSVPFWYTGWMKMSIINSLATHITSRDFNVQTESIEVLSMLLLPKDIKAFERWT